MDERFLHVFTCVVADRQTNRQCFLFYMANERIQRSSSQLTTGQSLCLLSS